MKRRRFLFNSIVGGAGITALNQLNVYAGNNDNANINGQSPLLTIGICTDLHHDLITDGEKRLQAFINEMNIIKPDFIIQMGDLCVPKEKNLPLMKIWNQFSGPKYHVIGNHDTDGGFNHDDVVKFWDAKGKYYSFDVNGYHFIVLNGNERPAGDNSKGYPRSVTTEQLNWLVNDLDATNLPVIIFCHQGIDNDLDGLKEGNQIRIIFERANQKAGFQKVRMVFSGHHHEDYHNVYNNVHYVQINSISYQFAHLENDYAFAHTKDPIWAVLTVYKDGVAKISGKKSSYEIPPNTWKGHLAYPTVPYISDRVIALTNKAYKTDTAL